MIPHKFLLFTPATLLGLICAPFCQAEINQVESLGGDVYFHEGDLKGHGHCNNGWVIFEDYVLVIDANFPSGAEEIIPKIKAQTSKPIRFAFDTHHHGDHAYGNQIWVDQGAVPVAHVGVIEEMKKYETGHYGTQPGRWEDTAKSRKDVAATRLKPPTLLFPDSLIFDDGKHRVELHYFGVAHTHGDGFAWLPKEKILFTGDACVNGPYNFVGDGDTGAWIETLAKARQLSPEIICPGHGPRGRVSVIEDQAAFFTELRKEVRERFSKGATPEAMKAAVEGIKDSLQKNQRIARYVGDSLPGQVEKVYREMGGKAFLTPQAWWDQEDRHAAAHGHELAQGRGLIRQTR